MIKFNHKQSEHATMTKETFKKAFIKKVEEISGEKLEDSTTQNQY